MQLRVRAARWRWTVAAAVVAALVVGALIVRQNERARAVAHRVTHDPVVLAAGDIACSPGSSSFHDNAGTPTACRARATSDLALELSPTAVLALGDIQYGSGSLADYAASFDRTWGRLRSVLYPVPGNREYEHDPDARTYFAYFGNAAGQPGRGYYSFDLGRWHIVALNSNIDRGSDSAQARWLLADLARSRARCTLALWHHPRFSSDPKPNDSVVAFWRALYQYKADIVLNGHAHMYERFAPQTPGGSTATDHGIRQFIVGTGGEGLDRGHRPRRVTSETANQTMFGLLQLGLHNGSYDWRFVPEPGRHFTDAGHGACNPK
jgi:acid phosphatase type 7